MRYVLCALLVCSAGFMSVAQQDRPKQGRRREPSPGTLHSISVKGNRLYSSAAIIKDSGLKIGQRVTGPIIEQARAKLQSTELFNNVADEFRFSGDPPSYDLTFEVAENDQVFPMRFERLGVSTDAVQQYLQNHLELYADRIPGTQGVLKRYTAAVQDFVGQTNPSMEVRARVSNDDPKQLAILFAPATPPPTISQVIVSGNQAVDTGTILRAVNQVAVGVPLSDTRLKLILDGAIKPLYAAKGYADVTFPKVETEPSKANRGVVVKVEINDGPVFKFGSIHFHGNGMDEEEIRSNIPFKPGQAFNGQQIDNFRLDLVHRMKRRGLLDASVASEIQPDASKRTVDITYNISPGGVYNFQTLDIQGLDINTQPVIARLWGEKPGKPFNPDYPDFFLQRVQEQGLFDNLADTRADYTADPASHSVTVHLYFKGGKSKQEKAKERKEDEERKQGDGTSSPYPPFD
jgi:outer membrane protein insertion porin family